MRHADRMESMVSFDARREDEEDMVAILEEIAREKGFVWPDFSLKRGEVRPYQLFRYLIQTHPEVEKLKAEWAHDRYVNECHQKAADLERQALAEG